MATAARQGGIPCHAVVGADALSDFDKRLLDLGIVLEAGDERALERAGERLGRSLAG